MAVLLSIGYGVGVWWTTRAVTTAETSTQRIAKRADILADQARELAADLDRQRQRTDRECTRANEERERADAALLKADDLSKQLLAARSELAQAYRQQIEADIAALDAVRAGHGRDGGPKGGDEATGGIPATHAGG